MRKAVAFFLAIALASMSAPPLLGGPPAAFAATAAASPHAFTYTYYSDLAFKGGGEETLAVGKAKKLDLVNLSGAIEWSSSDRSVAAVTQAGVVSARSPGVARISAKNLGTGRSVVCTVKVYKRCSQAQARKAILALKTTYYPGRRWTNRNYYYWQAANCHCYGCIAFAGIASDRAFGRYAPFKRHAKFSHIKAGDHVRVAGSHSVVVLCKKKKAIVVAEGNYDATFNWGRKIPYAELKRQGFYVETRY